MSNGSLIGSCEITINSSLKRISMLEGQNINPLQFELREWIYYIDSNEKIIILFL